MFERYTQTARRPIFHARYAASQDGGEYIETEHLPLGIMRGDAAFAQRLFKTREDLLAVQAEIAKEMGPGGKTATSMDIPLSQECKRVLARTSAEAERLKHPQISTGHLLLGLLMEERCLASKVMTAHGLTVAQLQKEAVDAANADTAESGGMASKFASKIAEMVRPLPDVKPGPPAELSGSHGGGQG